MGFDYMDIVWYVLAAIAGLFFAWLAAKPHIDKIFRIKFCAVCAAVVSTWVVLLALNLLRIVNSQLLLAILMGQSIAGATYLMEKSEKLRGFKIIAVLVGTVVVYYLLKWI